MYFLRKYVFKCEIFFLSLGHTQSIIKMRNSLCVPVFYLELGLNKFFHTSAQMGISYIKCVLEEV